MSTSYSGSNCILNEHEYFGHYHPYAIPYRYYHCTAILQVWQAIRWRYWYVSTNEYNPDRPYSKEWSKSVKLALSPPMAWHLAGDKTHTRQNGNADRWCVYMHYQPRSVIQYSIFTQNTVQGNAENDISVHMLMYMSTRPTLERWETPGHFKSINPNMINHFASQQQACQLFLIFLASKGNCEKRCTCWTGEDQLQIWSSHFSNTNNHLYYLLVYYRVRSWNNGMRCMSLYSYEFAIWPYCFVGHSCPGGICPESDPLSPTCSITTTMLGTLLMIDT